MRITTSTTTTTTGRRAAGGRRRAHDHALLFLLAIVCTFSGVVVTASSSSSKEEEEKKNLIRHGGGTTTRKDSGTAAVERIVEEYDEDEDDGEEDEIHVLNEDDTESVMKLVDLDLRFPSSITTTTTEDDEDDEDDEDEDNDFNRRRRRNLIVVTQNQRRKLDLLGIETRNDEERRRVLQGCNVDQSWIGDGYCDDDTEGYNTAACQWDGGDCCQSTCQETDEYPCKQTMVCLNPNASENANTRQQQEQQQGGNNKKNNCNAPNKQWLGDGYCDQDSLYNNAECNYDEGDCCEETCVEGIKLKCPKSEMICLDPSITNTATTSNLINPPVLDDGLMTAIGGDGMNSNFDSSSSLGCMMISGNSAKNANIQKLTTGYQNIGGEATEVAGYMFDVATKTSKPPKILGFELNIEKVGIHTFQVYTRIGKHEGRENSMVGWLDLGEYPVIGTGEYLPSKLVLTNPVQLPTGQRQSFYLIQMNNDDINTFDKRSTNGNINSIFKEDERIKIFLGTGKRGNPFQMRNIEGLGFSGSLLYADEDVDIMTDCGGNGNGNKIGNGGPSTGIIGTTMAPMVDTTLEPFDTTVDTNGGNGGSSCTGASSKRLTTGYQDIGGEVTEVEGIMFDLMSKSTSTGITITGFDLNIEKSGTHTFQIYTRAGTHCGHENSNSGWIDLGTYSVPAGGEYLPTKLALGVSKHVVLPPQGYKQSFYIIQTNNDDINTYDRRPNQPSTDDVFKQNGIEAIFKQDEKLKLFLGTGKRGMEFNMNDMKGVGFSGSVLYEECGTTPPTPSHDLDVCANNGGGGNGGGGNNSPPSTGGGNNGDCTADPSWLGDGYCDDATEGVNTKACDWDGGDCCPQTCQDSTYACPESVMKCMDDDIKGDGGGGGNGGGGGGGGGNNGGGNTGGGGGDGNNNSNNLTSDQKEWLDLHNQRRMKYHTKYGSPYTPLVYSKHLERSSQQWADELVKIPCRDFYHDPANDYGENLAWMTGSDSRERVMTMWVEEEELQPTEAYKSGHGHMTQVLWRATKYVGCAEAKRDRCTMYVCRYIKPGNCNRGTYTWLADTMANDSPCGPDCPPGEGCFSPHD